jgi:NTP pyrophosphatase (non-canonical NTP hydrolase)
MDVTLRNKGSDTTLDEYQARSGTLAVYPGRGNYQVIYPVVALAEEAGELAGKLLKLFQVQYMAAPGAPDHPVADAALTLAATNGLILGLLKKAYRNEPQGQLTPERVEQIRQALILGHRALHQVSDAIMAGGQFAFPPIVIPDGELDVVVKEAGDPLWYVAAFCTEARVALGYVGDVNYAKLVDRKKRGVIASTGDDR